METEEPINYNLVSNAPTIINHSEPPVYSLGGRGHTVVGFPFLHSSSVLFQQLDPFIMSNITLWIYTALMWTSQNMLYHLEQDLVFYRLKQRHWVTNWLMKGHTPLYIDRIPNIVQACISRYMPPPDLSHWRCVPHISKHLQHFRCVSEEWSWTTLETAPVPVQPQLSPSYTGFQQTVQTKSVTNYRKRKARDLIKKYKPHRVLPKWQTTCVDLRKQHLRKDDFS